MHLPSIMLGILFFILLYVGIHIVKFIKLFSSDIKKKGTIIISLFYLFIVAAAFFMSFYSMIREETIFRTIGYGVLLMVLYMMFGFAVYDTVYLLAYIYCKLQKRKAEGKIYEFTHNKKVKRVYNAVIICLSFIIVLYGGIHIKQIKIKNHDIVINKSNADISSMNVVIISDIHLGADIGKKEVKKMVERINSLNPDIVFIAGDIFNNSIDSLKEQDEVSELFKSIKTVYGVYACLGNHDIDWRSSDGGNGQVLGYDRISEFLSKSGIILLNDKAVLIADSFYVAGRKEASVIGGRQNRLSIDELLAGIDTDKPVFLLDHRPEAVNEAVEAGVDLIMCGHTHNGQIFPGNLIIALTNEYGYGYYQKNDTNIIVSSGIGYWGLPYRIASDCEIVQIKIEFNK